MRHIERSLRDEDIPVILRWLDTPMRARRGQRGSATRQRRCDGPLQRGVLNALLSSPHELSQDEIADRVWANREDGGGSIKTIQKAIHRLRGHLVGSGYVLASRRTRGYIIEPEVFE